MPIRQIENEIRSVKPDETHPVRTDKSEGQHLTRTKYRVGPDGKKTIAPDDDHAEADRVYNAGAEGRKKALRSFLGLKDDESSDNKPSFRESFVQGAKDATREMTGEMMNKTNSMRGGLKKAIQDVENHKKLEPLGTKK